MFELCAVCMMIYCCVQGTWVWSDGTALDYNLWGSGQGTEGTSENCMAMKPGQRWYDTSCTYTTYYVCKL